MKTHKQWWSWVVAVAGLAFMLQAPLIAKAQDAQVVQDSQAAPDAQNPQNFSRFAGCQYAGSSEPRGAAELHGGIGFVSARWRE